MDTKRCSTCKEIKPLSEFHKNKSTKDGLQKSCKNCMKKVRAKHKEKNKAKAPPIETELKHCSSCKELKLYSEFYKCRTKKDGYHCQCKKCMAKYNSTIAAIINKKRYREKHPDKVRDTWLKSAYSISIEIYDKIFNEQQGRCKICGYQETEQDWGCTKRLAVDHDHDTLKIRGLLCSNCNRLLGCAKDNTDILKKCIAYLENN